MYKKCTCTVHMYALALTCQKYWWDKAILGVVTDECMDVSQLLGARDRAPPKVYAMYLRMYVCMAVGPCVHVYSVSVYACIYACMYVYMYVCVCM